MFMNLSRARPRSFNRIPALDQDPRTGESVDEQAAYSAVLARVSTHQNADYRAQRSFNDDWQIQEAFKHALQTFLSKLLVFTLALLLFPGAASTVHWLEH